VSYIVEYTPAALRQLAKLTQGIQAQLKPKIDALADNPRPPDAIKLQGIDNTYRIRVGDYRVLYEIHDKTLLVLIVEVGHRGRVYRRRR
jgi:mRNA interferase RelE/StbE